MKTLKPALDQVRVSRERRTDTALSGYSILIVEDEPLIALDVHAALSTSGASLIAATRLAEARDLIRHAEVSAAVVDINLGGEDCSSVCQALSDHRIPFIFYTGNANADVIKAWPHAPVLTKPASPECILVTVAKLLQ